MRRVNRCGRRIANYRQRDTEVMLLSLQYVQATVVNIYSHRFIGCKGYRNILKSTKFCSVIDIPTLAESWTGIGLWCGVTLERSWLPLVDGALLVNTTNVRGPCVHQIATNLYQAALLHVQVAQQSQSFLGLCLPKPSNPLYSAQNYRIH